jgi:acyl-coenzyme A synthetase/AMP-(fatty) acid ligase
MIPEAAIAMLACARIGAPHSVVFGGFSADALLSRIQDADAKIVITAKRLHRLFTASTAVSLGSNVKRAGSYPRLEQVA